MKKKEAALSRLLFPEVKRVKVHAYLTGKIRGVTYAPLNSSSFLGVIRALVSLLRYRKLSLFFGVHSSHRSFLTLGLEQGQGESSALVHHLEVLRTSSSCEVK